SRSAARGESADQRYTAALQRAIARRQNLSVSDGDDRRGIPRRLYHARAANDRRETLWPVHQRGGVARGVVADATGIQVSHMSFGNPRQRSQPQILPPVPALSDQAMHRPVRGENRQAAVS